MRRYEQKGLRIAGLKIMNVTEELARKHYAEHVNKPFFPGLLEYITSGRCSVDKGLAIFLNNQRNPSKKLTVNVAFY